MKKWLIGFCVLSFSFGPSGTTWASVLDDAAGITLAGLGGCIGSCGGVGDPKVRDLAVREKPGSLRWSNGKLVVDVQRQWGIDTDSDIYADGWTGWGAVWEWRKRAANEYFNARYVMGSQLLNGGSSVRMSMVGTAEPNSGSQTPRSYVSPTQATPSGYTTLVDTKLGTYNWTYWGEWDYTRDQFIGHARRNLRGRAILQNAGGSRVNPAFEMGKVHAKSVDPFPTGGTLYLHIVYEP